MQKNIGLKSQVQTDWFTKSRLALYRSYILYITSIVSIIDYITYIDYITIYIKSYMNILYSYICYIDKPM